MEQRRSPARPARFGRAVAVGGVVLALAVGTACGSDPAAEGSSSPSSDTTSLAPDGDAVDGGALVVGIQNDVTGWNPTADTWGTAAAFAGSSFLESLTTLDAQGNVEPWLATDWDPNDDYTSWTLTLREGVQFHDGQPFDAEAVKANFDDVMASPLTSIALGGAIEGATVVGDQVRIDLSEPWAAFPSSFLAGPNAWMRPRCWAPRPAVR